ncbi:hypothetical protein EIN_025900 [Entamoeba invadens IP1]|uniref:hypothetical protein n=1 Tax=Entamoeba invadens IP1 TaxID=370355 RepID=UPI0002C3EDB0|nr:hypothetical protein EIN_025900 [Entamoeba invadens IP1]ELP90751.1 hypothetical protein EIN_025900 [Entamoeba invadens IP1]|eukprot:XP_004257522.1 hypothetical protein EIN_025900 [Entamoeba invadens IP1]
MDSIYDKEFEEAAKVFFGEMGKYVEKMTDYRREERNAKLKADTLNAEDKRSKEDVRREIDTNFSKYSQTVLAVTAVSDIVDSLSNVLGDLKAIVEFEGKKVLETRQKINTDVDKLKTLDATFTGKKLTQLYVTGDLTGLIPWNKELFKETQKPLQTETKEERPKFFDSPQTKQDQQDKEKRVEEANKAEHKEERTHPTGYSMKKSTPLSERKSGTEQKEESQKTGEKEKTENKGKPKEAKYKQTKATRVTKEPKEDTKEKNKENTGDQHRCSKAEVLEPKFLKHTCLPLIKDWIHLRRHQLLFNACERFDIEEFWKAVEGKSNVAIVVMNNDEVFGVFSQSQLMKGKWTVDYYHFAFNIARKCNVINRLMYGIDGKEGVSIGDKDVVFEFGNPQIGSVKVAMVGEYGKIVNGEKTYKFSDNTILGDEQFKVNQIVAYQFN